MPDVFISYSSKDAELAKGLVKNLESHGISVWFDDNALLVGQDVVDEVYDGIRNSQYLAIVLTHNSVNSKWVKQELNFAKVTEIERHAVVILPLLLEDCEIPSSIRTKKYADFRTDYAAGFHQLLQALASSKLPKNQDDQIIELEDLLA